MASRPAFAALGCLQCRTRVLRAVASNSNTLLRTAALSSAALRPQTFRRAFSSLPRDVPGASSPDQIARVDPETDGPDAQSKNPIVGNQDAGPAEKAEASDTPWFLQEEPPKHAPSQHVQPLPDLPESSPTILEPLMKFVYDEMGLDDLSLLDLRALDPPPALGPNLLMLFATARSERHLHVSSSRLVKWLRHTHHIESNADGLIGPGELKTKLRRMRRKAKLLGSSTMAAKGDDDGITTGWICVNLGTLGAAYGEAAHYDADGNMTGFGAPITGTTIVVQVMTDSRRKELNLERLWSQQLIKSESQKENLLQGAQFHNRFGKLPPTTIRSNKATMSADQKRAFSTSPRRLAPFVIEPETKETDARSAQPKVPASEPTPRTLSLGRVRRRIEKIRWEAKPVDREECLRYVKDIFWATSRDKNHDQNQVDLITKLIYLMNERGFPVMDHEILVTMIESIATSKSYGDKLGGIKTSCEVVVLSGKGSCPSELQLKRLLKVYASLGDWEQMWQVWRLPPRFGKRRGPDLYACLFGTVALSGDALQCMDVLRKCVPEMLAEEPPVLATTLVWTQFRACIEIASPGVEKEANMIAAQRAHGRTKPSAWPATPEFARMYMDVEALRRAV
ncbi:ATPase synthesis protein 25 [Colletotrichum trifolii]|uniref:ATPase synthesis protein 25 n=1 Tax=Colletotrichum trifolii TaxID=5466 RepID=A0A4V3HWA5_COLTR|nr:ATPase synthesis protein 25 [Colletotrichum trifolii]